MQKTKIVIFRKGGKLSVNDRWFYNRSQIEWFILWKSKKIAQKAIFSLQKMLQKFDDIKCNMYFDLFDKLITPILCFGSEVWGFNRGDKIERVHLHFLKKIIITSKMYTGNNIVHSELCKLNMQAERHLRIFRYWLKFVKSNDHRLTRNVYDMLLIDLHNGKSNLSSYWK